VEGMVTKNFLNYPENTGLTKNVLRVGQKAILLQTCQVVCRTCPLTLRDRMNFLNQICKISLTSGILPEVHPLYKKR